MARRKALFLAMGLSLILIFSSGLAWAGDGALDPTFNPGVGVQKIPLTRGQVTWTTGGYANGNSLIFGYFTSITDGNGTHPVKSIAKLIDFTGTVDTSFNFLVNGEVRGAYLANPEQSVEPHCDIIIWGSFSLTGTDPTDASTTFYNLARLHWNGSAYAVDTSFPVIFNQVLTGAGAQVSVVNAVAVMGDYLSSYVLVGGTNMQVQGDSTHGYHLIRLNPNFSYDSTYGPTNPYTQAKSLPGGNVDGIGIPSNNQPMIVGTLPVADANGKWTGAYHWREFYQSNLTTLQYSLGDQPTSGINYGPIDGPIFSMAQTSTGQMIIGGVFTHVYGTAMNHLAQLNSTLTGLDNTNGFNSTISTLGGPKGAVQNILIQGSGQPVLAGSFWGFNGTDYGHIVRLKLDGTVDTSFNYSGGKPLAGADDRIFKLFSFQTSSTQSYMQILGSFRHYNGAAQGGIATLKPSDGSLYTSNYPSPFAANSDTPGTVYAIETTWGNNQPQIVIGGDFTGVGGKFHLNLARLNNDGTVDDSFSTYMDGQVNAIRSLDNGQMLIAGHFGYAQGFGCTSLARVNQDSSFDSTFRPIVAKGDGLLPGLRMVDRQDSGVIDIGGNFASVADSNHILQTRNAFALLNADGTLNPDFNAQFNIPNGDKIKVNIGGTMGSGYGMAGYVRYNDQGVYKDYGFGCVFDQSGIQQKYMLFNGEVLCGTGNGGKSGGVVVGGNFTQVVSPVIANRGHIAALTSDFTLDSSFAGIGANGPIYDLRSNGDNDTGKPLIAGAFSTYNGVSRIGVARLTFDGSLDATFNPGTGANGPVYAIRWTNWDNNGPTIGKALLGGAFATYNGTSRPGIARVFASLGAKIVPIYSYLLLLGD